MKIVLLDTGRGVSAETIRMWRENLELLDTDEVELMAWQPPVEPLPVARHFVFGPRLDVRRPEPLSMQTLNGSDGADVDVADLVAEPAASERGGVAGAGGEESPVSVSDLAGQMGEVVQDHVTPGRIADPNGEVYRTGAEARASVSLPKYHPERVRQGVKWRSRRVKAKAVQVKRAAKANIKASDRPLAKVAQQAIAVRHGSISTRFAVALSRSRTASEVFAGADLVFPVDARSQRGAWLLARRHPGPDVVVGYPAAKRALRARRAR
ncbi:hypothetical protein [Dermatophilus congolensis]|uniref:hypothetical protein n=1 Tax=Dermatophilus congolensis TaxID=1863 RepID=UPI001AAE2639|nr:hypothetical protein [Dermatophilus congolensis]MBO3129952.1 hypothetical protein [Dermatophilus congolensis]MBO3131418.1 hypothetical protein [Dermatophilus congolensis]MBO3134426.1 hypothetical protein [Dermatophilus congolensis]MBO3136662.1 hypothetical protein [Dermatophilus congolensis]MBO3138906.1 hypothetical protein [Dermatophilus congolensis]